ncbi:MAG: thiamine pyrophosphate TPP-binding protein [Bradyrhizobium sp.]|nr:thiamine pyrophosphate TPP-binding protein [Bradyrhizobium sp.]
MVKQYLDQGISRRAFTAGLTAVGFSVAAAKSMAQSRSTPLAATASPGIREMRGTGGAMFTQQLKAAGVEYIFFNPSTGDCPIFDSLVDEPGIQLIQGVQEGACVAMADGYARVSGKPGIVVVANIGLPNAVTQLVNSWKDPIPVVVAAASGGQDTLGDDAFQEYDHIESMTQPITKWHWVAQTQQPRPTSSSTICRQCSDRASRFQRLPRSTCELAARARNSWRLVAPSATISPASAPPKDRVTNGVVRLRR